MLMLDLMQFMVLKWYLKIENKMKEHDYCVTNVINKIENYAGSIHGTKTFEDDAGNEIELDEFDLLIKFLSNIFCAKTIIDKALVEQAKLELLIDMYDDRINNFLHFFMIIILII